MTIRSLQSLAHDEIVHLARERAEAGDDTPHGFPVGSAQAVTYETQFLARKRELEEVEA